MQNTHAIDNCVVNTVLDCDSQNIYVKVVDNTTFSTYDVQCDIMHFPNADSLEDIYKLLTNCLNRVENHACLLYVKIGVLQLTFSAQFSGYYRVKHELQLKERVSVEQKCNAICARLLALEQKFMSNSGETPTTNKEETNATLLPSPRIEVENQSVAVPKVTVVRKTTETIKMLADEVKLLGKEIIDNELKYIAEIDSLKHKIKEVYTYCNKINESLSVKVENLEHKSTNKCQDEHKSTNMCKKKAVDNRPTIDE